MHNDGFKFVISLSIQLNYMKCNACMHDFEFEILGMLQLIFSLGIDKNIVDVDNDKLVQILMKDRVHEPH